MFYLLAITIFGHYLMQVRDLSVIGFLLLIL